MCLWQAMMVLGGSISIGDVTWHSQLQTLQLRQQMLCGSVVLSGARSQVWSQGNPSGWLCTYEVLGVLVICFQFSS